MFLIIGLGNPGTKYEQTRHNLGFRVLDLISSETLWQNKYHSQFLKLNDVILAKPQTFMNKSGEAVMEILKFYPEATLIVVHDDLDFALGSVRLQKNISGAGHNGVQSIINKLGHQDFIRMRIGIDNPQIRGQIAGDEFVLQQFASDEEKFVNEVLVKAKDAIETIQTQGLDIAQSKFNG